MTTDHVPAAHHSCPSGEFLIAALTTGVSDDEQHWLDTHLDTCDRCLDAVGAATYRLRIAGEISVAVPEALRQRAAAATMPEPAAALLPEPRPAPDRPAPSRPAAGEPDTRWSAAARRWLATLLQPPVMLPAALAIAAVLVVATQTWLTPGTPQPLTRSITVPQRVRVTALEAPVRRQPSGHAEIVASVTRGMLVEINGEERDWSRVTLPDGREGWVDQQALR